MLKRIGLLSLLGLVLVCLLSVGLYYLPPVHERLAWRLESMGTRIRYALNPPGKAVFIPQGQPVANADAASTIDAIVEATLDAVLATSTPDTPTNTPTVVGPSPTPQSSPTPTFTPTAIPDKVILSGAVHEYQKMNNCGPTTLAMGLSFWGWQGDQFVTRAYLRPNDPRVDDKNVMPAEMVAFVETQTNLKALVRVGGDVEMLKHLIAAGFPVLIEKGFQPPKEDWMGHFELVTGYDDARQRFITQDSYIMADFPLPYQDLLEHWWRDFNDVYLVIYPPERESEVMAVLGPQADETYNYQYAAQKDRQETETLSGRDLFMAWYDLGTNLVALGAYGEAANAYDNAFAVYPTIPEKDRPWRMLWYQVGPYEAYYQTGRYQDVIDLGNNTLAALGKPVLEETFYWLGRAREAQGDLQRAIQDYQTAYDLNPRSTPALDELKRLGVEVP